MKHMRCTFWSMNKTKLKFVFATVVKRPETADLEMRALL